MITKKKVELVNPWFIMAMICLAPVKSWAEQGGRSENPGINVLYGIAENCKEVFSELKNKKGSSEKSETQEKCMDKEISRMKKLDAQKKILSG